MTELEILRWAAYGIECKKEEELHRHKCVPPDDSIEAWCEAVKKIPSEQRKLLEKLNTLNGKLNDIVSKIEQIKMPSEYLELLRQAYQLEHEIEQMKIDSNGSCAKLEELVRSSNAHEKYVELIQEIHKNHVFIQKMFFVIDQKMSKL